MRRKYSNQPYWHWWAFGLGGILLLLGSFLRVDAQAAKLTIVTTGADSLFAPVLSQPMKLLQSIGITPKQIQQLAEHPRIFVAGAGFVRDLSLTPLAGTKSAQNATSSIQVSGEGVVQILGLAVLPHLSDVKSSPSSIHVAGDGVVRDVSLTAPNAP